MKEAGRPPKYKSNEELENAIQKYMDNIPTVKRVITNSVSIDVPVPTISGLCYHLGFESRQSFYDLEKDDRFSYTIKRARLFIENEYEKQLQVGNTTGAIFALKNFGWKDKQEIENTGSLDIRTIKFKKFNNE